MQFACDYIRLSAENKQKLEKGELDAYELMTRPKKEFEKSIMIAGGICTYGVGKLMLLNGTENEFCYAQAILNYKNDIKELNKSNKKLIFEQDGAPAHTSKANKALLNKCFGEDWIQNPPNSPDLAYPIETLWGILKERIKKKLPKNLEELVKYTFDEWNSIPQSLIKNLCDNYIKRIKKVLEIGGERLEREHLNELRNEKKKETKKKYLEYQEEELYAEKHEWELKKYKIINIYNDQELLKKKGDYKNKQIFEKNSFFF